MHTRAIMMYHVVQHELAHVEHDPNIDFEEWFEVSNTAEALQRLADSERIDCSMLQSTSVWNLAQDFEINEDLVKAGWGPKMKVLYGVDFDLVTDDD